MTPRIPLSLIAHSEKAAWVSFLCLRKSDVVLIPVVGSVGMLLVWSIIHSFLVTTMPTPTLPMLVNSSFTFAKLFRNYVEVMSLIEKSAHIA
ncbi:MAG: hypothetical protein SWJ54_21030, partial [Cyanobacteriota bacterium]|nr:hypothetical protein [Cyanobacteriota bacterium]